jgi:hypothetical protein
MIRKIATYTLAAFAVAISLSSCQILGKSSAKYSFADGIYKTKRFGGKEVYVLKVDEDTISVFQVQEFKDSTAILTHQRVNYTSRQRKFKDNKMQHTFYKPSFDVDAMTIAMKYRPGIKGVPNQLTTNFNGAVFAGYRTDAYRLNYKRTPLNMYKQSVKHMGFSMGLYAGLGSSIIDGTTLNNPASTVQYEGVLLITGIAVTTAMQNITFGLSLGTDHLLDKYSGQWIYEGQPYIGFTLGLNIN